MGRNNRPVTAPRHSPLEGYARLFANASDERTVQVRELPFLAMIDLRVAGDDSHVFERIEKAIGVPVPAEPVRACGPATAAGRSVAWMGPGWWLVIAEPDAETEVVEDLHSAIGPVPASVVDVSAWRTVVELRGPRARDVLRTGCSVDLHPRAFPPGACAQTMLARSQVLLHHLPSPNPVSAPAYRVFVRASYASYLGHWLLDAMAEHHPDVPRLGPEVR